MLSRLARFIWRHLPLATNTKWHIKTRCFRWAPWAFRWSEPYREWKALEREFGPGVATVVSAVDETPEPMPLSRAAPYSTPPARLIAFYLPQFHPIPENDQWWGRGFTEWYNVVRAKPQFVGHYQPRLPGELGFYDLRLIEIQRRQVELAKLYGIGGFCFYFYWFAGKRLLEDPIKQFVSDTSLKLPFCLCWANENWSRRWDGRGDHLLIEQRHSPEDDVTFIAYVSTFFRDPRYIRIGNRPLLVIYRPDLLPSAGETAKRWRDWCLNNGIGEIFLAYTQSFEIVDPRSYGFDSAIEFPPNNSNAPDITHQVENLNAEFRGVVYDWRVLPKRSRAYKAADYSVFRTVCPSWDNEPRRRGMGTVYLNSSPEGYEEWLLNACDETFVRAAEAEERLVFVNAWNEWAEGAHLEPDERYGYSYLAATRRALQAASERYERRKSASRDAAGEDIRSSTETAPGTRPDKLFHPSSEARKAETTAEGDAPLDPVLSVVIHAFYPDLLVEMLDLLSRWEPAFRLWITTPAEQSRTVLRIVDSAALRGCDNPRILECTNRGRDILPFLKVLDHLKPGEQEIILKLHTKKTVHRDDGDLWRRDLYEKLLEPRGVKRLLEAFKSDRDLGIIAAKGHLVALSHHWGGNEKCIDALCDRMGLMYPRARGERFPGGSMFFSRFWAIAPIVKLQLGDEDFPVEAGQKDGTTAHAIERLFGTVCHARGGKLTVTGHRLGEMTDNSTEAYLHANSDHLAHKLRKAFNIAPPDIPIP